MASKGPECSICFERFNDENKCPRMLSCGHSFCSCCLERLLRGNTIDCPKCRNPVAVPSGVHGLLKNFALLDIVNETAPKQHAENTGHVGSHECEACDEKHPANFCCLDCKENMCKTAAQFHTRNKASREHRVVSLEELEANPQLASVSVVCPEHNDQFRFFDQDCGRVICRDCYALNHSGHKCVVAAEAASKYRQDMEALVTKASSQVEKIKVAEAKVMGEVLLMEEAREEQRDKIQSFFREVWHIFVIGVNEIDAARSIPYHLRVTIRIIYCRLTVFDNNWIKEQNNLNVECSIQLFVNSYPKLTPMS